MNYEALKQFHENEALVRTCQSVIGRLVLWALAVLFLAWHGVSPLMMGALGLVMIFPVQRHVILSFAAVGMIVEKMLEASGLELSKDIPLLSLLLLAGIGSLYAFYVLVRNFEKWPAIFRNFPVFTIQVCIWIALFLSTLPALGALAMIPFLGWRLSYMIMHSSWRKSGNERFRDHLFYLVPVYGGTLTPYGKGVDFLSRREATDAESFARSQLAGIKLLILAMMWAYLLDLLNISLFGETGKHIASWPETWTLGLSGLGEQLTTGAHSPWYQGWATVYLELIRSTLRIAVAGHVIVGCLRLLGFNVFRNTYKPLLSESIVEFWNRYYYYFKEILVDFFFYPTFVRLRALSPNVRMLGAVFAAAFAGNMYHHILANPDTVLLMDPAGFWATWGSRFFYCFLLAVGIWISMLRQQKARLGHVKNGFHFRLRRIAGVWTYYGIIQIWTIAPTGVGITDAFGFFLSLFGA